MVAPLAWSEAVVGSTLVLPVLFSSLAVCRKCFLDEKCLRAFNAENARGPSKAELILKCAAMESVESRNTDLEKVSATA